MVTARINFWGILRQVVDQKQITMTMPAEFSMQELVDSLADAVGNTVRQEMVSASHRGYLQGHVQVYVDGHSTRGDLNQRFGPFSEDKSQIDIYFVPIAEGGEE